MTDKRDDKLKVRVMARYEDNNPGPWSIEYEEPHEPQLLDARGQPVAGIKLWEDDADLTARLVTEANQRVAAAGPALLAACEALLTADSLTDPIRDHLRAAVKQAREGGR